MLGYEVRKMGAPHNCLDDATAAMKLVLAKIKHGIDNAIPLVQRPVTVSLCVIIAILISWLLITRGLYYLCFPFFRFLKVRWQSFFFTEYQLMLRVKNYIKLFLGTSH